MRRLQRKRRKRSEERKKKQQRVGTRLVELRFFAAEKDVVVVLDTWRRRDLFSYCAPV